MLSSPSDKIASLFNPSALSPSAASKRLEFSDAITELDVEWLHEYLIWNEGDPNQSISTELDPDMHPLSFLLIVNGVNKIPNDDLHQCITILIHDRANICHSAIKYKEDPLGLTPADYAAIFGDTEIGARVLTDRIVQDGLAGGSNRKPFKPNYERLFFVTRVFGEIPAEHHVKAIAEKTAQLLAQTQGNLKDLRDVWGDERAKRLGRHLRCAIPVWEWMSDAIRDAIRAPVNPMDCHGLSIMADRLYFLELADYLRANIPNDRDRQIRPRPAS